MFMLCIGASGVNAAKRDGDPSIDALAETQAQAVSAITELAPGRARLGGEISAGQTLAAGRFRIVKELGRGGMGCVYEAYDEAYGTKVALKTFLAAHAEALLGLKNEFRALAGVMHTNLVELHELICDEELWFMTMELVPGCNLAQWLEQRAVAREAFDVEYERTLRAMLLQIAQGIAALHAAGKLHRDLKPSNIMVAPDGRVVILDFGLVADAHRKPDALEQNVIAGTPAYFAPEQAAGQAAIAASDWYALGVMTYEAVSGRLPFSGSLARMLQAKQSSDAPPVEARAARVPEDLAALCRELLQRDPGLRARAADVFATLAAQPDTAQPGAVPSWVPPRGAGSGESLLGRDSELAELRAAFDAAACGQVAGVWVHGPSGIGKSTLLGHFLQQLETHAHALVLRGRCYERESVPYKACDAMIDALSRRLSAWPADEADALRPLFSHALLRVFPMLGRVPFLAYAAQNEGPLPSDQQELRRQGFVALRDLLHRLGARTPIVLYIDDLQWGDLDSAKLLAALLAPPAPRHGLLLLGSVRSDERASGELLPALAHDEELALSFRPREIALGPLPQATALRMAELALGERGELAREVAREAEGSPFFIAELARHFSEDPARAHRSEGRAELAQVIEERVARLPGDARALLEIVAVSGRPIESEVALLASELRTTDRRVLSRLEAAHLLRAQRTQDGERLETYHDRVRSAVVSALQLPALRRVHRAIADTLERAAASDPERLALHFREADEGPKAAHYAARAGDNAYRALAFERAANWYALALQGAAGSAEQRGLRIQLGDALTYAGRGAQAARHYLQAAESAGGDEAIELQRRASEQLLISGHREEGLTTLSSVLKASGIAGPDRGLPLARLIAQRVRLRMRGPAFIAREGARVDPALLRRVDACSVAARTLIVREPVKGAIFGTMHLRLALDAGEPSRIVEGLATEIMYTATEGSRAAARVASLIASARAIELGQREPGARAYLTTALAANALLNGRFAQAEQAAAEAETIYRERCTGVTGPLNLARCIWAPAVLFMGDVPTAMNALGGWLEDAREREDLEAEGQLAVYKLYGALAAGDIAAVREGLQPSLARWRPGHRETAGMTALQMLTGLELCAQASAPVLVRVRDQFQPFFRSFLSRVQLYRIVVMSYCANLELAIAAQDHQRASRLRRAEAFATRIERERVGHASAVAQLIRGGVAHQRGDADAAVMHLRNACDGLAGVAQRLWAACARMRLGQVLGGSEGTHHHAEANSEMLRLGVVHPERFVNVHAPGYPA